jgi:hypothetical protein
MTEINRGQGNYRRGLVLGFTLAETVLLLIFALLLVLSFLLAQKEAQIEKANADMAEIIRDPNLARNVSVLLEELRTSPNGINRFDDLFRELRAIKEGNNRLEKELAVVRDGLASVDNALVESNFQGGENRIDSIKKATRSAQQYTKLVEKTGASGFVAEIEKKDSEISTFKGQVAYLQRQLGICKGLGKGSSYPPCWADEEGKPEFIYDVAVTEVGMLMKLANPQRREADLERLPIQNVTCNKELPVEEFVKMTYPLYNWSVEHSCRFFVRLYDNTGPTQKEQYKKRRKTVEGHFYILHLEGLL